MLYIEWKIYTHQGDARDDMFNVYFWFSIDFQTWDVIPDGTLIVFSREKADGELFASHDSESYVESWQRCGSARWVIFLKVDIMCRN